MSTREIESQGSVNTNNASKTNRYRPEIDGLRAFAVVAVIINHFNKDILPGGYLGVDIFFVISGYVITSSLFGRPSKDFKDFISGFYERRIKRLVPALSVFVLITSIAICLFNPTPILTLRTGITSLFGLSNLYLLKQSTNYFGQSTQLNVFTHTWSLGVEEQFYILFPFLIWFSGFGRQTKNGARNLFLAVGTLTIASLIGFLYLYPTNQPAAYFLMPSRFWEMAAGCLIFIGFQKRASIEQSLEKVPPLLILALIVGVMYLPMSMASASTIAVVALASILIASLKKQTAAFNIFTHPSVVYIGLISYSLYLWHWGVLSISRWTIGIHWWSVPFQVALMLGLAVASYRWIETPLRKGNWFGKRSITLSIGGVVISSLSMYLFALYKTPASKLIAAIGSNVVPPVSQSLSKVPQEDLYCHFPRSIDTAFEDCFLSGEKDVNDMNIYLIGDSHASNHHWSIDSAITKGGFNYSLNTLVEIGFINAVIGDDSCPGDGSQCLRNAWASYKIFFEENLKENDLIFFSYARDRVNSPSNSLPRSAGQSIDLLQARLQEIAELAKSKSARLLLIGDIPKVCRGDVNYVHEILRMRWFESCTVYKNTSIEDRVGLHDVYRQLEKSNNNVLLVDPHDELCSEFTCSAYDASSDLILYSDSSPHFNINSKFILVDFWRRQFNLLQQ